jgi:hypothetical protein
MEKMNSKMKSAIKSASECEEVCVKTINHCLEIGGEHAEKSHIALLTDCAEICALAKHSMMRESSVHMSICKACAEVCDACAESCEKLDGKEMEDCAKACRKCAEDCREMSS